MTPVQTRLSIACIAAGMALAALALPAAAATPAPQQASATVPAQPAPPAKPTRDASRKDGPAMPTWDALTDAQREVLVAPIRERWNGDVSERNRMYGRAQRWQSMTPEQRRDAQRGMRRWDHMSPDQRDKARAKFDAFRDLPPEQQAAARAKFKAMTPEQRRAYVDRNAAPSARPTAPAAAPAEKTTP